jgi:hypothetical protein
MVWLMSIAGFGGGVMTWRNWSGPTVFDAGTSRTFGLVVGVEVALAGAGTVLLVAALWSLASVPLWS